MQNTWLDARLEQIVRAKGFAWLVTHNDLTILISQVRKLVAIEPIVY
ncbi:GTP-binding protein [Bacillus sp. Bos-x628]